MAHFAKLDKNNVVIFVTIGRDEDDGKEVELSQRTGDIYKQTSYNTRGGVYYTPGTGTPHPDQSKSFRKNFAGLGYIYNEEIDGFVPPKPHNSWIINNQTGLWEPPIPYPKDENYYIWDETTISWIKVEE